MNKNVLSNFLKLSMFGALLTSRGKIFHKLGAATIKDLSPNVLYVLKLTHLSKIPFELERNLYLPSFLIADAAKEPEATERSQQI